MYVTKIVQYFQETNANTIFIFFICILVSFNLYKHLFASN